MARQDDPTVEMQVDLSAFDDERPTSKTVDAYVPLDAVPVLAVARNDVNWFELSSDATALVLRIDGSSTLMELTDGGWIAPAEASRVLGQLVREGVAKLR